MTKQEKIKEGLLSKIRSIRNWRSRTDDPLSAEDDVTDILNYLRHKGVVIKVDGELPEDCISYLENKQGVIKSVWVDKDKLANAGYESVEPLI